MSARRSLRRRVAVTLATFSALASLALATLIYLASHDLERRLIDEMLTAELDDFIIRRQRSPRSAPERTATIRTFVIAPTGGAMPTPPEVAALAPGRHELTLAGTPYRAAVRRVGEQRLVVLFDVSALRHRERVFLLLLSVGVLMITSISALSGRWLATLVIAPVTELARRVAGLRPEDAPPPLADEFPWQEVQQLAADFDGYLARLHAFIERECRFTGDVSHELRTPMAVIAGATELLQTDATLNERSRMRVARIDRAVTEMKEMTTALLALAREQETSPSGTPGCDVTTVVETLVERQRALLDGRSVALRLDARAWPHLPVDRAVLSMVLGNLLRNALAFTQEGQVTIQVEANAIEVHDTGQGIGHDVGDHAFLPYVRGRDSDGAGLGLSLVQRLCARTGWQITLTDRPGGGTVARLAFVSGNPQVAKRIAAP